MTTLTVSELATTLDTDARTARKFLRSITPIDAQPGKGSRWVIEARQVRSLTSQFKKFTAAQETAKLDREAAKAIDEDSMLLDGPIDLEPTDGEIDPE